MPSSDHYLPRASRAPTLGAGAIAEYREAGWTITAGGHVCSGTVTGPCARCRRPCWRYGPAGRPLCADCTRERGR